jgi:crotonobetainyl-CoA:carnitine CoA-transferase CaiB-like acyl-CoA transferase
MKEVFDDPQVVARGMKIDADGIPSVRLPVLFSDVEQKELRASPKLGEHQSLLD